MITDGTLLNESEWPEKQLFGTFNGNYNCNVVVPCNEDSMIFSFLAKGHGVLITTVTATTGASKSLVSLYR